MSCPRCGSGAVYRGKCRECGAEVKIHRVTGANPPVGRIPRFGEGTNAASELGRGTGQRTAAAEIPAPRSTPAAASRPPHRRAEVCASERASADALAPREPGRLAPAEAGARGPEGPGDDGRARRPSSVAASVEQPPAGEVMGWREPEAVRPAEPPRAMPVAVAAGFQALVGAAGILMGRQELYASLGAGLEAGLAALLLARMSFGRALLPAVVAWDFGWAITLVVARGRPHLGPLTALPGLLLLGANFAKSPAARWSCAVASMALSTAAGLAA
jgi:hypothetical protein